MLYDNCCEHIEGLQSIMASCDASILKDLPPELTKLMGHLVKKWWSEHDLPNVANRLCKNLEVSIFSAYCDVLTFCVDIHLYIFLGCRRRRRKLRRPKVSIMKNNLEMLVMMKAHRCIMMPVTLHLILLKVTKTRPNVTKIVRREKGEVSHLECSRLFWFM
jgi:hypothetical protein